jgi:hypothetical protein
MPIMITFRTGRVAPFAALIALAACSGEQQDWRAAEAARTREAYAHFLEQHPGSELAAKAREHIGQLDEDRDWEEAGKLGTLDAYRLFLAAHPHGRWSQEARIRIESFALGSIPRLEPQRPVRPGERAAGVRLLELASAAPASPAGAAAAPPGSSAAAAAAPGSPARPGKPGGYAVQLGAFGSQASADRAWQRLQSRFGAELSGLTPRVVTADGGQLYRLQASTAGEAQARALCNSLKQQSQACVPVLPR